MRCAVLLPVLLAPAVVVALTVGSGSASGAFSPGPTGPRSHDAVLVAKQNVDDLLGTRLMQVNIGTAAMANKTKTAKDSLVLEEISESGYVASQAQRHRTSSHGSSAARRHRYSRQRSQTAEQEGTDVRWASHRESPNWSGYSSSNLNQGISSGSGAEEVEQVAQEASTGSARSSAGATAAVRGLARQLAGLRASLQVLEAQAFCAAASEGVRAEMAYIARDVDDLRRRLADVLTAAPACPEGVGAASSLFVVPEAGQRGGGASGGGASDSEVQMQERQLPRPGSELRSALDSLSRTFDLPWYGLLQRAPAAPVDRPPPPGLSGTEERTEESLIQTSILEAHGQESVVRHNPWDEMLNKQGYGILRPNSDLQPRSWALPLVFLLLAAMVVLATGVVVFPLPSKGDKLDVAMSRPAQTRWKSQFAQVALPFWMATTPSSTGAAFAVLFVSLLATTASLNFWLGYAALYVLRCFDPETAAVINQARIFENESLMTICAIGVALAPTCFLPFQRQLGTRRRQWLLLGLKMFLLFESQFVKIVGTYLARIQMNNIVNLNADAFWHITRTLQLALLLIGCIDAFAGSYVESMLLLEWRKELSQYVLKRYMGAQAYYKMDSNSSKDDGADNPDQRIQGDTLTFTTELNNFAFSVISAVVSLISSTALIWTVVPQVTVMLLLYVIAGSLISLWFIWNFVGINYNIEKTEADYRYALVHVRDNAEGIAFQSGERQGENEINRRFRELVEARKTKISWEMAFSSFSFAFTAGGTIVPCVLLAELFFQMKLDVGVVAQVGLTLARVVSCFSFINNSATTMSTLAAATNRIAGLLRKIDNLGGAGQICRTPTADHEVRVSALAVRTPSNRLLVQNLDLKLGGEDGPARLVIVGRSGVGKTSLLRALSGLWNHGCGKVGMPDRGGVMFLPQRPYLTLGSLRSQLCFPDGEARAEDAELLELLGQVGLGELPKRFESGLGAVCDWARVLSLGEQQRIAAARCLLHKPKMVVLDEATSALTVLDEALLYTRLADLDMSFISVALRDSVVRFHEKVLELSDDPAKWKITSSRAYLATQEASSAECAGSRRAITLVVRDLKGQDTNFKVYANSPLQRLMEFYCAERGVDNSQVMFHTMGKCLEKNCTPEDLGLDDMTVIRAMPKAESCASFDSDDDGSRSARSSAMSCP